MYTYIYIHIYIYVVNTSDQNFLGSNNVASHPWIESNDDDDDKDDDDGDDDDDNDNDDGDNNDDNDDDVVYLKKITTRVSENLTLHKNGDQPKA
jgi:hypothetical protein